MSSEAPKSEETRTDGAVTPPSSDTNPPAEPTDAPAAIPPAAAEHCATTDAAAAGDAAADASTVTSDAPQATAEPATAAPATAAPATDDATPADGAGTEGTTAESPTAESPTAESPTAESPTAESPTAESSAQPARKRPRLNSGQDAPAIPSLGPATTQAAPVPDAQPAEDVQRSEADTPPETDTPPAPTQPTIPVDVPADQNLDAELEAEISAALSNDALATDSVSSATAPAQESATDDESTQDTIEPGTRLSGQVENIDQEHVFVDLGFRSPGIIQIRQFESAKPPQVGQSLEVVVDRVDEADGLIVLSLPRGKRRVGGDWNAISRGQVVDCIVNKTNKGGLEVSVSNLRGFLPAGQIDLAYVSDMEEYVGKKLTVQITEVNPKKRNLVVSRRALLLEERKAKEQEVWETIETGQVHSGQVKTLKDYGAFIDIGNVDGFLHIGEISWSRINHPSDVLTVGQSVDVKIISLDPEKKRIGLGMRQLAQNPWNLAESNYSVGSSVAGQVTRTAQFGAFVELEPGVEGLIHISELDYSRVNKVSDVLQVGQDVEVKVLNVETDRKRISLSLKAMNPAPEPTVEEVAETDPAEDAERELKRENLKGGMGGASQGGLFGNPGDYK